MGLEAHAAAGDRCHTETLTESRESHDSRPVPPVRPDPEECCNSGCDRCVFELYEDALERYEAELRAWQRRQSGGGGKA